jgi:heat shock protein HslJ
MKRLPLLLLLLAGLATACDDNPVGPSNVQDVTWKLETIERAGNAAITVPNPEQYTIRFEANNNLAVRADCNSCSGRYALNGSSLSISSMACTLIFCQLGSLDGNYAQALENVQSWRIVDSKLVLSGAGFTLRFRS